MVEVVEMAARVPIGMDFWASFRSPDLLEPAMMPAATHAWNRQEVGVVNTPVTEGKNIPMRTRKLVARVAVT